MENKSTLEKMLGYFQSQCWAKPLDYMNTENGLYLAQTMGWNNPGSFTILQFYPFYTQCWVKNNPNVGLNEP